MKRSCIRIGVVRGAVLGAALVLGPVLAGGCRDVEKVEIPNIFRQTPERPLADVPVPVGFRFKEQGSFVFNSNYRVARLRYSGTPKIEEVVRFYREQMPLSLAAEGVVRYVWKSAFGPMLIEVRDGVAFVNGEAVTPIADTERGAA